MYLAPMLDSTFTHTGIITDGVCWHNIMAHVGKIEATVVEIRHFEFKRNSTTLLKEQCALLYRSPLSTR